MLVKFLCCDKMPEATNLKGGLFWLELLFVLFCFCGEERMKHEVGCSRAQTLSSWCDRGRERRNDQGQDTAFKYTSLVTRSLHPDLTAGSGPPPESDTRLQIHPWISHVTKRHHDRFHPPSPKPFISELAGDVAKSGCIIGNAKACWK